MVIYMRSLPLGLAAGRASVCLGLKYSPQVAAEEVQEVGEESSHYP